MTAIFKNGRYWSQYSVFQIVNLTICLTMVKNIYIDTKIVKIG